MREFFNSWRRKVGVVTLVMSVALLAGWITSLVYHDDGYWPITRTVLVEIASEDGVFCVWFSHAVDTNYFPKNARWNRTPRGNRTTTLLDAIEEWRKILVIGNAGVFGRPDDWIQQVDYFYVLSIPYRIAAPLMSILSAYLILWKPRQAKTPVGD